MSRELTSLDSVLEIERHVNHQKSDLRAQLQKAERNKNLRSIMLTLPWYALFCSHLRFLF